MTTYSNLLSLCKAHYYDYRVLRVYHSSIPHSPAAVKIAAGKLLSPASTTISLCRNCFPEPAFAGQKGSSDGFAGRKVLVVRDLMLDRYFLGDVTSISPEAPVPVLTVTAQKSAAGERRM
jgi:hypothetical protein